MWMNPPKNEHEMRYRQQINELQNQLAAIDHRFGRMQQLHDERIAMLVAQNENLRIRLDQHQQQQQQQQQQQNHHQSSQYRPHPQHHPQHHPQQQNQQQRNRYGPHPQQQNKHQRYHSHTHQQSQHQRYLPHPQQQNQQHIQQQNQQQQQEQNQQQQQIPSLSRNNSSNLSNDLSTGSLDGKPKVIGAGRINQALNAIHLIDYYVRRYQRLPDNRDAYLAGKFV